MSHKVKPKPSKIKQIQQLFKQLTLKIYLLIKHAFKNKLGRKYKLNITTQITLTLFKLKYNLPDRVLEALFDIDHVTIKRAINRITPLISSISFNNFQSNLYIVDSTTIRIGKCKTNKTFSGYKHFHGVKFQVVINDFSKIIASSNFYESSIHDKKIFLQEYETLKPNIDKTLLILGDKAYVGLTGHKVKTPIKRNELEYRNNKEATKTENKNLSSKRIKIEHVFAWMKHFRILNNNFYYKLDKINCFFKAITNIYNLSKA